MGLDARLTGSARGRFLLEFFGNSAHFPIANLIYELLREGPEEYVRVADPYVLVLAALVQSAVLTRWGASPLRRFAGNLAGPALYTAIEGTLEGPARFLAAPHHSAYWMFALAVGALQAIRPGAPDRVRAPLLVLEHVVRACIFLAMYAIFEATTDPRFATLDGFLADPSHRFATLVIPLLGVAAGLADQSAQRYLTLLRATAVELRRYAEFLLGRALLARAVDDPSGLRPIRRERAVLFADVRGFTSWCDARPPEDVVAMLGRYYAAVEDALAPHQPIRVKFTADEAMAVFETAESAVAAGRALREATRGVLAPLELAVGIGIHQGPLVEGLLGSTSVRYYDVLGDTVNVANRIERQASAGEIWVSADAIGSLAAAPSGERRAISLKGKANAIVAVRID